MTKEGTTGAGSGATGDAAAAAKALAEAAAAKVITDAAAAKVIADANAATAAAAATDGSTGSTGTDGEGGLPNWELRFKGLQPKYQTIVEARKVEKTAWEEDKLKLMGKIAVLETETEARQTSITDITKQLESATTSTSEQTKIVDDLNKKLERNALIMGTYPELALMEAKGLLPAGKEGDELTKMLDDMRSVLSLTGAKVLQDLTAGSTEDGVTSTGSRTQGDDITSISEKLMEANLKGDAAEIKRLTDLLIVAQNKIYAAQQPAARGSI